MNTFTFFTLMICAIFALASAVPLPKAPAEMEVEGAEAIPGDDVLEGAESRSYDYNGRGRWHGGGRGGGSRGGGGGRRHYGYDNYYYGHGR